VIDVLFLRPRGLAGALLVIKVAGAMAEQGKTMSEIVDVCQSIRGHLRTIGLSASGIRAPGQQQSFEVDPIATFLSNVKVLCILLN
jgi:dihydroxyacetone kinase